MSKQLIIPGKEINVLTPEELAEIFEKPQYQVLLSIGAADSLEEVHDNVPAKGFRSVCTAYQRGGGSDNYVVQPAAFQELCSFRQGRIAGTIQNIGANPCFTYLAPVRHVQRQPFGAINGFIVGYLAAAGGEFDFKVSNKVWGGPITLYSPLGTTLVWGEH